MSVISEKKPKSRRQRSWIRTASLFLVLIFLVNLMLQIVMNLNYVHTIREEVVQENSNASRIWARTVDSQLEAMNENLHELLIMIYNRTELRTGSEMMKATIKREINDAMTAKILSNPHIDFLSLRDIESGLYLFTAHSALPGVTVTGLKKMNEAYAVPNARNFRDDSWDVIYDGKESYLIKSVLLGKYVLSEASALSHYPVEDITVVSGEQPVLVLEDGKEVFFFTAEDREKQADMIDEDGSFRENRRMLTSYAEMAHMDVRVALSVDRASVQSFSVFRNAILLIAISAFSLLLIVGFYIFLNRQVVRPTREMMAAISEIQDGNRGYQIPGTARNREFQDLSDNFNEMSREIRTAQEEELERLKKEEEDKLHLLRAQIKPHFYLNAITTISNMTYQGRQEDIRKYCVVLAKYMRYMLEMQSDFTTVGEELSHIGNYITLQQIRFPGSVSAEIHCDDEVRDTRIPLLVMFTIVENSFKHAMDLYREMRLTIDCRKDPEGCRIRITDNGPGFSEDVLENRNDTDTVFRTRNHIGLSNAAHTLRLTYHRPDLLVLSNVPEGGACADILIPVQTEIQLEES